MTDQSTDSSTVAVSDSHTEVSQLPEVSGFSWAAMRNDIIVGAVVPFENGAPVTENPHEQVRKLFAMMRAALRQHDCDPAELMQAVFYVTDMSLREEINRHWAAWPDHDNASRAVIGVSALAVEGLAVEATFIAMKGD